MIKELKMNKDGPVQVDHVIMAGGSTRIRAFKEKIKGLSDGAKVHSWSERAEEIYAFGAARQAVLRNSPAVIPAPTPVRRLNTKIFFDENEQKIENCLSQAREAEAADNLSEAIDIVNKVLVSCHFICR